MVGSIIVFSGMDGAGKSTQIERLEQSLTRAGQKSVSFWSRGGYTPGMNLLKSLVRRGSGGRAIPTSGPSQARTKAFRRPWIRKLWLMLAIVDLMMLYGIWLRLQSWMGRVVICDRFLEDSALDFLINFPEENTCDWWLWRALLWICPRPDVVILLLVSVAESQRRSQLKNEPFPDSADVLERRLIAYRSWDRQSAFADRVVVIDGQQSVEDVARIIESRVGCLHSDPSLKPIPRSRTA